MALVSGHKAKIHKDASVSHAKHTVASDFHNKKHSSVSVHKGGGKKGRGHSKKTTLK